MKENKKEKKESSRTGKIFFAFLYARQQLRIAKKYQGTQCGGALHDFEDSAANAPDYNEGAENVFQWQRFLGLGIAVFQLRSDGVQFPRSDGEQLFCIAPPHCVPWYCLAILSLCLAYKKKKKYGKVDRQKDIDQLVSVV